jgi:hypothetical protein
MHKRISDWIWANLFDVYGGFVIGLCICSICSVPLAKARPEPVTTWTVLLVTALTFVFWRFFRVGTASLTCVLTVCGWSCIFGAATGLATFFAAGLSNMLMAALYHFRRSPD